MVHGEVSANTENLFEIVLHGQSYRPELEAIAARVQSARIAANTALGAGSGPIKPELLLAGLLADVETNTQFVSNLHDALRVLGVTKASITTASTDEINDGMKAASFDGEKLGTEFIERERTARPWIVATMESGLSPNEAGLPEEFFPWNYRLLQTQEQGLTDLADDRDDADGSGWNPFDGSEAERNRIDRVAAMQRSAHDQSARLLGADDSGRLTRVEAIAALGDWTGDRNWEGDQYGNWVNAYYNANLAKNEAGGVTLDPHNSGGLSDDFGLIARELAIEPDVALSFYNGIGVEGTAYLPTVLVDTIDRSEDDRVLHRVMADYGAGLGHASNQRTINGDKALGFSGKALISQTSLTRPGDPVDVDHPDTVRSSSADGPRATQEIYHQSLLFAAGDFDQSFLVDATVETMIQASLNQAAAGSIQSTTGRGGAVRIRSRGEDPRNILLARSGERVGTAAAVVDQLALKNQVDLLLYHDASYRASYRGNTAFAPTLDSDVPVTSFLHAAGFNDRAAHRILKEASRERGRSTPIADAQFSDVGVAAGVDGILARHATLMYPENSVENVGARRTTINAQTSPIGRPTTFGDSDLKTKEWKAAHSKVLYYGQGRLLNQKAKELLINSIEGAIVDGNFDEQLSAPFATFLGGIEAETVEGIFSHNARLDDEARDYNQRVNTVVSAGLGVAGLAGPAISAAAGAGGGLQTFFDPFSVPTNNELEAYREQYKHLMLVQSDHSTEWSNTLNSQFLLQAVDQGEIELVVPGTVEPQSVPLRRFEDHIFQWQHPDSEKWLELPVATDSRNRDYFTDTEVKKVIGRAIDPHRNYVNGLLYATDNKEDVVERRVDGSIDEHIQKQTLTTAAKERLNEANADALSVRLNEWVADGH